MNHTGEGKDPVVATGPSPDIVVHLSSEYWPYARSGGLGEAVRGIALHQVKAGYPTAVFVPLYRGIRGRFELERCGEPFEVDVGWRKHQIQIWRHVQPQPSPCTWFVGCDELFDRGGLYGDEYGEFGDNPLRFAVYSRAALAWLPQLSDTPPTLHIHDWHASVAAVQLRALLQDDPWYRQVPVVVTVHNGGYQGWYHAGLIHDLGLPEWLNDDRFMRWKGNANLLRGGLAFADMVTTVSPNHALELKTDMGGAGLDPVYREMGNSLVGILNGIDYEVWNPETDPEILENYDSTTLHLRAANKARLQRHLGLDLDPDAPLFSMTARLAHQKGFDIILPSGVIGAEGTQWAFLGEGEERYARALGELAAAHPGRVAATFTFEERREHHLLGAADFLLMPSLYEPCGLTQMRSQRYGSLPVARRVGGLADTIVEGETGILFDEYTPESFADAIHRARALYADRERMNAAIKTAMHRDFSWENSVIRYRSVYDQAHRNRSAAIGG